MANVFLTLLSNRSEYGTVNSNQIDPSGYEPPQTLHITATPVDSNFAFSHWSDGDLNSSRDYVLSQDTILTAYFYRKKNLLDRVAVAIENLVNKAGLDRFWGNLKSWLSSSDGASRIGFDNDDTTFDSETVQGALLEVKAQADASDSDIALVKRTYMPLPNYFYTIVGGSGNMTWTAVTASDNYSPYTVYYFNQSEIINFVTNPCRNDTYDPNKVYWEISIDPVTEDQIYTKWTPSSVLPETSFNNNKDHLYHVDAQGINSWESYVASGNLWTGMPSGSLSMKWSTQSQFPNGVMPHSGIMTVCCGHNNHITITDTTIGLSVQNAGRDKYGTGQEIVTFPVIKGHGYQVIASHTRHGGGPLGNIILFLFGD